jgi:hypothetical protein
VLVSKTRIYGVVVVAALALVAGGCTGTTTGPPPTGTSSASVAPRPVSTSSASFKYSTADGHTATVTVVIGVPRKAVDGLRNGALALGAACSWNYDTDGAIPVTITMTNTTANYTGDGVVHWIVTGSSAVVSAELGYSDTSSCMGSGNMTSAASGPGIRWVAMAPNVTGTHVAFLQVANFASPTAPDGDMNVLKGMSIQLTTVLLGEIPMSIGGNAQNLPKIPVVPAA